MHDDGRIADHGISYLESEPIRRFNSQDCGNGSHVFAADSVNTAALDQMAGEKAQVAAGGQREAHGLMAIDGG